MFKKLKSLFSSSRVSQNLKRTPRVAVSHLQETVFQIVSPSNHKIGLNNLSTTGFGLKINLDKKWQQVGVVLNGFLVINGKSVKLSCQVRHVTGLTVGCEFLSRTKTLEDDIHNFLSAEVSGLGLRRVSKSLMEQPADWYVDSNGNEVFVEKTEDGKIEHFYASFLSNWVEWSHNQDAKFGYILKGEAEGVKMIKGSPLVRLFEIPPPGIEDLFSKFLFGITEMPDSEKKEIMRRLVA